MRIIITFLGIGLVLMGCRRTPPSEYGLTASDATPGVMVWKTQGLADYHRFTVDPVKVSTTAGVTLDPQITDRIAEQMRRELVVRLADGYEVVTPPGARVARLSVEVTDVRPGPALGLGYANIRATVTDSLTGSPLVAIADRRHHADEVNPTLQSPWESARHVMLSWADAVDAEVERLAR